MTGAGKAIGPPKRLFDDFSGFATATDEDYQVLLTSGLVSLDTNVLLDLYRQQSAAVDQLLTAIEFLGNRLWFTHQVLFEFHRNREGAISEPADAAEKTTDDVRKLQQQVLERFRQWAVRVALHPDRESELRRQVEAGFDALISGIGDILLSHDPESAIDTNTDPVLERLDAIVTGRRGGPMSPTAYPAALTEGKRRIEAKIPPGYRDAGKDKRPDAEGATGDYLVWEQFLAEAAARQTDGLFVTRDVKDDWYRLRNGEVQGPRNELSEEYFARTGHRLFMLRASSWLHHMLPLLGAASAVAADVTEAELDDVGMTGPDTHEVQISGGRGWSRVSLMRLMDDLSAAYPIQTKAIQEAARNGGTVSREEVYALANYDADRSLRRFTRPIDRLGRRLEEEGLLPYYAQPPLIPLYNFPGMGTNRAVGFELSSGFHAVYGAIYGDKPPNADDAVPPPAV